MNQNRLPAVGDTVMVYEQESKQPVPAEVLKKRVSFLDGKAFFLLRTANGEWWRSEDTILDSGVN